MTSCLIQLQSFQYLLSIPNWCFIHFVYPIYPCLHKFQYLVFSSSLAPTALWNLLKFFIQPTSICISIYPQYFPKITLIHLYSFASLLIFNVFSCHFHQVTYLFSWNEHLFLYQWVVWNLFQSFSRSYRIYSLTAYWNYTPSIFASTRITCSTL